MRGKKAKLSQAAKLWSSYVSARRALIENRIARSFKSAESELAEWLVATLLDGQLVDNRVNPFYDVVAGKKKIQVKSHAKSPTNRAGYFIDAKKDRLNNPKTGATHYAFVFFDNMYPSEIFVVPESFVRRFHKNELKRNDFLDKYRFQTDLQMFHE